MAQDIIQYGNYSMSTLDTSVDDTHARATARARVSSTRQFLRGKAWGPRRSRTKNSSFQSVSNNRRRQKTYQTRPTEHTGCS